MSYCTKNSLHGRRASRAAVTLLELLLTLTLIGIFTATASMRLSPETQSNVGARSQARRLSLDLIQAQRRAISTGQNHFVQMTSGASGITGYTVRRRTASGSEVVETRDFSNGITVTASHAELEFTFEGAALATYQVTLAGPDHTWQASVVPITGAVRVIQL